jgi:hypothetical protein
MTAEGKEPIMGFNKYSGDEGPHREPIMKFNK